MNKFSITANPVEATVTASISATLTAAELLELITELMQARAQIAHEPTNPEGARVTLFTQANWYTQLAAGTGPDSVLLLLAPGLGWVGLTLNPVDRTRLAAFLAHQQAAVMISAQGGPAAAPDDRHNTGGGLVH